MHKSITLFVMNIKVEVSARHCHISAKDLEKLFGIGYKLTSIKDLSQIGEFASKEKVTLKTKGGELGLRILGPVRDQTQIELSMTDSYSVKLKPPLRLSGDLKKSAGGILIGPNGKVILKEGVVIAKRHLHCDPLSAKKLKLRNNQKISVETVGERAMVFKNILVRVKDTYTLALHVDTDEGNAAMTGGVCGFGKMLK